MITSEFLSLSAQQQKEDKLSNSLVSNTSNLVSADVKWLTLQLSCQTNYIHKTS